MKKTKETVEIEERERNMTFEEAIARLEEIVRALESGSAPLDESLALFEEGVGLVKLCNERLDGAEQKVRLLTKNPDGSVCYLIGVRKAIRQKLHNGDGDPIHVIIEAGE